MNTNTHAEQTIGQLRKSRNLWRTFALVGMAASVVLAVLFAHLKYVSVDSDFPDDPFDYTWGWDGRVLNSTWKETGNPAGVSVDGNFNGIYEYQEIYDLHGRLSSTYVDVDDNGIIDSVLQWHSSGALAEVWLDEIQLALATRGIVYDTQGRRISDMFDVNKDGKIDSSLTYWPSGLQTVDVDRDSDGWFDHCTVLDSVGNVIRTYPSSELERWLSTGE